MNGATTDVLKELWVRHTYITVSLLNIVSHWIESDFVCIAACSNACITCCFSRARHWIGRHENHRCIIGCPRPLLLNGHRFRGASHRSIFLPFEWASQPCFSQVKNLIFTPARDLDKMYGKARTLAQIYHIFGWISTAGLLANIYTSWLSISAITYISQSEKLVMAYLDTALPLLAALASIHTQADLTNTISMGKHAPSWMRW